MDLAARENAVSDRSIFDLQELLQKIALRDKADESREFATRLQTSLSALSTRSNDNAKNRGVKRSSFCRADRRVHAERAGRDRIPHQRKR